MAQKEGVQIYSHDVIYRFLDDVKTVMSEFLQVEATETVLGEAKILQVSVLLKNRKDSSAVTSRISLNLVFACKLRVTNCSPVGRSIVVIVFVLSYSNCFDGVVMLV